MRIDHAFDNTARVPGPQPIPPPTSGERPIAYADRLGRWYANQSTPEQQQQFGQYLTPIEVAKFMASLYAPLDNRTVRILDPGAGAGILSCAMCEMLAQRPSSLSEIYLEAYEVDAHLIPVLMACLTHVQCWLQERGIVLRFHAIRGDFILTHAEALDQVPRLFTTWDVSEAGFDAIVSNPPYFKLPKSDPRAQAAAAVVHGQPNIYALFMAVSAALLKPGGELIVISPRSYTAGPYFRLFREWFFSHMRPEAIHQFGSRRDAFRRDEVLQENIILQARRCDDWVAGPNDQMIRVSLSAGIHDLSRAHQRRVALVDVLDWTSRDKVLGIPASSEDDLVSQIVHSWTGSLHAYGLEISTGPVVPFRALSLLSQQGDVPGTHAPLLWMQNVGPLRVEWPVDARGKAQYLLVQANAMSLLVADKNYVILRRFSAKEQRRRLTAAPLLAGTLGSPVIGLENHLNYIHRPGGSLTPEEAYGLAFLLNSRLLDTYFRIYNGNTQVSATELRAMPLPPQSILEEIGRRGMRQLCAPHQIDFLIADVLQLNSYSTIVQDMTHG